jgi:hypothetical protein
MHGVIYTTTFASEVRTKFSLNVANNLAKKYGLNLTNKLSDLDIMYEFDNIHEFEQFLVILLR